MILIGGAAKHDHVALRVGLEGRERFADDLMDFAACFLVADRRERAMRVGRRVRLDLVQERGDGVADCVIEEGVEAFPA